MHITSESFISIMAPLNELNHKENDMLIIIAILLFIIACGVAPNIMGFLLHLAIALIKIGFWGACLLLLASALASLFGA